MPSDEITKHKKEAYKRFHRYLVLNWLIYIHAFKGSSTDYIGRQSLQFTA